MIRSIQIHSVVPVWGFFIHTNRQIKNCCFVLPWDYFFKGSEILSGSPCPYPSFRSQRRFTRRILVLSSWNVAWYLLLIGNLNKVIEYQFKINICPSYLEMIGVFIFKFQFFAFPVMWGIELSKILGFISTFSKMRSVSMGRDPPAS